MIRVVQEFFGMHGRCREVQLPGGGAHHPILLSIAQVPAGAELAGWGKTHAPGLRIHYRARKEDLIALRCISRDRLAAAHHGRYEQDSRGALLLVESTAAPAHRRIIKLSYVVQTRSSAAMLPGVSLYCGDWLETLAVRPLLRLVIDNTRPRPDILPAEPSGRLLIQRAVE